jgi:hypothetical protein
VRSGFLIQRERSPFNTTSNVLSVDENGVQTSDQPISIFGSATQDRMDLQTVPMGRYPRRANLGIYS